MFVLLSKFIPALLFPVGLVCLLLLLALRLRDRSQPLKWLLISALGLLILAGNGWVSAQLVRSLEWRHLPPDSYPQVDAIVLLGGGTHSAAYPRQNVEFGEAGDRLVHAAWLYRGGYAPYILVTGGKLPWSLRAGSPAADMASLLTFMGVDESAIVLEERSVNTYENALFSKDILEAREAKTILLVTSAMHMPRSVLLFEKQGFEVIPAPTDFKIVEITESRPLREAWPNWVLGFIPSSSNLSSTSQVLKEYLGILIYGLRGWL
jgi:uncharacterized SAM-binding protein YcdF (DUF218 family)